MANSSIARMDNDTWWNRLRVEKNISYAVLGRIFNRSRQNYSDIFSGQRMPKDDTIRALCSVFNVDFDKGKSEFIKAHKTWCSKHGRGSPNSCSSRIQRSLSNAAHNDCTSIDLSPFLYGKVDYNTYMQVSEAANDTDKLKYLYGKLSWEDFSTLMILMRKGLTLWADAEIANILLRQ